MGMETLKKKSQPCPLRVTVVVTLIFLRIHQSWRENGGTVAMPALAYEESVVGRTFPP